MGAPVLPSRFAQRFWTGFVPAPAPASVSAFPFFCVLPNSQDTTPDPVNIDLSGWRPRRDSNPCYRRESTRSDRKLLKPRNTDGYLKRFQ